MLSEDNFPGNAGDVILEAEFTISGGLVLGAPFVQSITVTIPRSQPVGNYRLIVTADVNDEVTESEENNNVDFTADQVIQVDGIPLEDAIDNPEITFEDSEGGMVTTVIEVDTEGDGLWFGEGDIFFVGEGAPSGNNSAAESPPLELGQQSTLMAVIPGPARITFYWSSRTNSESNFVQFTIDGTEPEEGGRLDGVVGFTQASFILPAEENTVAWTYFQGAEPDELNPESVFVDAVSAEALTGFDLVIDNVEFEEGTFVPEQDLIEIVILARNQGVLLAIPEEFMVSVYLSQDQTLGNEDDILLADLDRFSDTFAEDDRFGYAPALDIPSMVVINNELVIIPSGNYFLIVSVDSSNLVDESDEDNNVFVTETNGIFIEPRPNLVPVSFDFITSFPDPETDPEPELILFGDEVQLFFSIRNEGLAINTASFKIQLVLSEDVDFGEASDFVFFSVTETTGLPVGQTRNYQFSRQVPPDTPIGDFFFMGLVVDAEGDVTESSETDNTVGSDDNSQVFSEFTVAQGVGTVDNGFSPNIRNNDLPGIDAPFFAQSLETFDGEAAPQSVDIIDNEVSGFEFDIDNPVGPSVISFAWKVESERAFVTQGSDEQQVLKFDTLNFLIDGVVVKFISGREPDIDWTVESFEVPQGTHTVRWEYQKDGSISSGRDAGWVDRIQTSSPDLEWLPDSADPLGDPGIKLLTVPPVDGFSSGAELQVQLRFTNTGIAEVRSTPPFSIQIRISPDPQYDEEDSQVKNDFILETFSYGLGLNPGEVVELVRNVQIPLNIAVADDYRLMARLDFFNVVLESGESNNEVLSSSADVPINPNISLDEALDFVAPFGWETGGDSTWFGQNSEFAPVAGNSDAVQSSPIGVGEETIIETQLTDFTDPALPQLVNFYWKVSSIQNFNLLRFLISDVEEKRISGDIDWTQ